MKRIGMLCLALFMVLSLASCGYLSPDAAMEAVGIGHSQQARIETADCYFYYWTVEETYADPGDRGEWITDVIPVEKTSAMFWHPVTRPSSYPMYLSGTQSSVGVLVVTDVNGLYHNFFIPEIVKNDPVTFSAELPADYDTITWNGREIELFRHSYFTTEQPVSEFSIGGVLLTREKM